MKRLRNSRGFLSAVALVLALLALLLRPVDAAEQRFYPPFEHFATGRVMNGNSGFFKHNNEIMFGKDPPSDKWQGFAKFDISEIPDNAVITEVSIGYHVISVSNPGPWTYIRHLELDPVTAQPEELWNGVINGAQATDQPIQEVKGWVERPLNASGVAAVQAGLAQDWVAFGFHKFDETEAKGHVKGYPAGPHKPYLKIAYAARDIGIDQITAPVGSVPFNSLVQPAVLVTNYGELDGPFQLVFEISESGNLLYQEELAVAQLGPGQTMAYVFPGWPTQGSGERVARARVNAEFDRNPANDQAVEWFRILGQGGNGGNGGNGEPPIVRWGWEETRSFPAGGLGRPVRQGGWLTVDPHTGLIYAGKGNRTGDFAVFDPIARTWRMLAQIPEGPSGRLPRNGTQAVAGADGYIYLVKGQGTSEFWRYSIAENVWEELPDVLAGPSNKNVRKGSSMAWVAQYGSGYVYLLRGPNNDFLRYDTEARSWEILSPAPIGQSRKWGNGAWLAYDGDAAIFAHKPKKNEMWRYDLNNDVWNPVGLPGIPLLGQGSQVRKASDGSSGAWKNGVLYALKGNKTGEFWKFDPMQNDWVELEPMPGSGSTGRVVRVNQGGALVSYPYGRTFYALKGNKTLEFWRYTMAPEGYRDGMAPEPLVEAGPIGLAERESLPLRVLPAAGGVARLQYDLAGREAASISVFDAAGRRVMSLSRTPEQNGAVELDLNGLSAGVYMVRIDAGDAAGAAKLVVSR